MSSRSLLQCRDKCRGVKRALSCGLLSSVLVIGCGGDDGDSQSSSGPVTIRGGERLSWDQAAASITELRSLAFRLYIDGRVSSLSDTSCIEVLRATGAQCSGQLPAMSSGQHVLELTSVMGGVESNRSGRLLVTVPGGPTSGPPMDGPAPAPTPAPAPRGVASPEQSALENSTVCSDEPPMDCYGVHVIAGGLGDVTALSPMPDGRVMFIESGQHVRIINSDADGDAIALAAVNNHQLTGLAIDTQFEKSQSVFIAWTELVRGVPVLNITRYRELGNVLGEGATIVTGLPVAPDSLTPLAVDDEGLIYVAVPADRSASGPRFLGEAGAVMRFDRDGRVPSSNQHASPIVAEGYPTPLALAIERPTQTVWLTGGDSQELGEVAVLGIPALSRGRWPSRPSAVQAQLNGLVESITIDETASARATEARLVIASEGKLRSVFLEHGIVRRSSSIRLGDAYVADTLATDRDGALYVGASSRDSGTLVLKLTKLSR